jgi:hypothetical protein
MIVRYFAPLALCLAAFAMPAHAADLATIGCVADKVPLTEKAQVVIDVERNLQETGKKHVYAPSVLQAVRAATTACAKENGWPDTALRPAMLYTLAKLGWPTAQKVAAEHGLDTAALEEAWDALPEDTRNRPMTKEVNEQLASAVVAEADRTPEKAELVGEFFGFLSLIQSTSYDFSQA